MYQRQIDEQNEEKSKNQEKLKQMNEEIEKF